MTKASVPSTKGEGFPKAGSKIFAGPQARESESELG